MNHNIIKTAITTSSIMKTSKQRIKTINQPTSFVLTGISITNNNKSLSTCTPFLNHLVHVHPSSIT